MSEVYKHKYFILNSNNIYIISERLSQTANLRLELALIHIKGWRIVPPSSHSVARTVLISKRDKVDSYDDDYDGKYFDNWLRHCE